MVNKRNTRKTSKPPIGSSRHSKRVGATKYKSTLPDIGVLLQRIAPTVGAKVNLEPQWKMVGQIVYASGQKRYFRLSSLDMNSMGASAVAKDKDYANFFMKRMGYPIVRGRTFFSKNWSKHVGPDRGIDAAHEFARTIGLPVIVKPNSGTRGQGVSLVYTKFEFYRALRQIFRKDDVALVQQQVRGKDYRIVVLDNKVISAYERIPLNIVGDGQSSIRQILENKQRKFNRANRDTVINLKDPRIANKLRRQRLSLESVVAKGTTIWLLDNANLSTGGDSVDVTDIVHPKFKAIAIRLTRDMGLRLCGVDIIVDGNIEDSPARYWVLEINSAPGLDHYGRSGKRQRKIVEDLYRQVLMRMK
jgi:D-alanine-D-alanine ligase-like ATP-grasp enzyme